MDEPWAASRVIDRALERAVQWPGPKPAAEPSTDFYDADAVTFVSVFEELTVGVADDTGTLEADEELRQRVEVHVAGHRQVETPAR
jgi:hypothetical protein